MGGKDLRKKRMTINVKNCEDPSRCFLTYTLTYGEYGGRGQAREVEVKKIAELTSPRPGEWRVSGVKNVKTYIDDREGISVPVP